MASVTDTPEVYPLLDTRQDNARTLITVLAIMAFLASLALVFALSANRLKTDWQDDLGRSATIQVMLENSEARDLKIKSALSILNAEFPGATINELSSDKSKALLRPWLGSVDIPDDLPIPSLISLEFSSAVALDIEDLKSQLSAEGLIVDIDDHSRWSTQIKRTGRGLLTSALAMLGLIFFACAAVSAFATQAALSAQRDVIRVLLQVGASDKFVTKLFTKQAGKRGLISGFIGGVLGTIVALIARIRRNADTALLPDLTFDFTDIFWLLLLALSLGMICALAAGVTSIRLLRQEHRRA